ncbi:MAG TPA: ATPase domain-containing protein [archaeon]|nr:ATPase domain-containing protein [archaeon]
MGKYALKRVKTGIPGLDALMSGGIPEGNVTLVSGECGVGKTTLGMQYLVYGAKKKEPGVFFTIEEDPERLKFYQMLLGWDIEELERKKMLRIVQPSLLKWKEIYTPNLLIDSIKKSIEETKAKRFVLDAVSALGYYIKDVFNLRRLIFTLSNMLKEKGCTSLIVSEIPEASTQLSTFGIEEYAADGVIVLRTLKVGESFIRTVCVRKMRGTDHSTKICPMRIIGKSGIEVFPTQEIFTK